MQGPRGCTLWVWLRASADSQRLWASLLLVQGRRPCPGLPPVFLSRACVVLAPHLRFSCSVQHQGRLSLDLSHRACSDYSEMRASHGSNSLPSSARLGNCTQDLLTVGPPSSSSCIIVLTSRGVPASPPFRGGGLGSALHLSFVCLLCLFLFPGGHGVVPGDPLAQEPCSLSLSLSVVLGDSHFWGCSPEQSLHLPMVQRLQPVRAGGQQPPSPG